MGYDPDATPEAMTPLSALEGYEIADGSVDIRGFTAEDEQGALLGKVVDLLVDPLREVVRFAVIRLAPAGDPGRPGPGVARVPIESITIDEAAGRVRLERAVEPGAPPRDESPGAPRRRRGGLVIAPGEEGGDVVGRVGRTGPPTPQPIVRGPAVQGQGAQERRETPEAGQGGARTVEGPGVAHPSPRTGEEPIESPEGTTDPRDPHDRS